VYWRVGGRRAVALGVTLSLALSSLVSANVPLVPQRQRGLQCSAVASSSPSALHLALRGGSSNPDTVWAAAADPSSGKTYYYNVKTKEVAWALPAGATLRPPRTAPSAAASTTVGDVATGVGQQASAGQGNAQPDAAPSAEQGTAAAAGEDAGDHGLGRNMEYPVTVHAPPVVGDVPAGFGRQASEPADAASNTNDAQAAVSQRQPETAAEAADVNAKPSLAAEESAGGAHQAVATQQQQAGAGQAASSGGEAAGVARPKLSPDSLWKEITDPTSGRVYYYHTITKESVWTLPTMEAINDDGQSTFTKFFSRLRTTAAVTTNVTSSLFKTVGGAAKTLATAAATSASSPAADPRAAAATAAVQPEMYWDAEKGQWLTRQGSNNAAAAPSAQGEMGWVWNGTDWVWQLKPVEQPAQQLLQQQQQQQQQQQPATQTSGETPSASATQAAIASTADSSMGPWQRHAAPDGQYYWWNSVTGESQWLPPTADQLAAR
jgi:hypothetical protein